MNFLKHLFKYFIINEPKQAIAILNLNHNSELLKFANQNFKNQVVIDLWEIQSLIDQEKFEFPNPDVGTIGIKI